MESVDFLVLELQILDGVASEGAQADQVSLL
jgi:hypothetical protein